MSKPNVTYVYHSPSTFIRKDIEFLRERYSVTEDTYNWNKKYLVPLILVLQFLKLLFTTNSSTVYVIMFAGYWSVIPVWISSVFGRKSLLIVGGTDCVSFPEFNYGSLRKPLISKAIKYSLSNCTAILPVAEELVGYDYTYFDAIQNKQGYINYFPEIKTPFRVIYNGYELPASKPEIDRNSNSFMTVAVISNKVVYELKGIDLFTEMAKTHPNFVFTIVGITNEVASAFKLDTISNLKCVPFVGKEELEKLFRQHQYYCCLSLSEGFPNALCEGMSYGCIPIGSDVSSIPFIIDNAGYVLKKRDSTMLSTLLKVVTELSEAEILEKSQKSRNRIANNFSLDKRKSRFYNIIEN